MKKWTSGMIEREITKIQYLEAAQQYGFTKRELELGFLKVSGFSNRRIAYMFGISEQTVKNHFTHIYEKAWVPGRKEFRELFLQEE
ncbi:MAG: LuxR C-terminal-related transcriptional regulator [Lachnospiraceae bacterium]|nr:LuxR C-terminal-related transcriptional regulator [Lachnospiraceae bacterium]